MAKEFVKKPGYEYAVSMELHTSWKDWGKQLTEHGKNGWRLCQVVAPLQSGIPFNDLVVLILEREIPQEPS